MTDTQKETTEKHQRIKGKQPRGERLKVPETEGTENRARTEEPSLLGAPPELSAAQRGGFERKRGQGVAVQMDR